MEVLVQWAEGIKRRSRDTKLGFLQHGELRTTSRLLMAQQPRQPVLGLFV